MTLNRTTEEYAEALRASRGLVTHAARRLGLTDEAVRRRLLRTPSLQQVRVEAREAMNDVAESALFAQVEAGEGWAVCFYLKTQAKDRGYIERSEQQHAVTGDIRIRIEAVDDRGDPALD